MSITLFVMADCENCVGVKEELEHIGLEYLLPISILSIKKNLKTGEMMAIDAEHNRFRCPEIPGVPAILFRNKLFVGSACCEYLRNELIGSSAYVSANENIAGL